MAANVTLRTCLQNLGFTQAAATYIVETQGFDTPEDYALLTDSEAMNICKITRRPGGTTGQGNNAQANPGIPVSLKAENHLKMLCYYFRYRQRVSRPLRNDLATVANIRQYLAQARLEESHEDPSPPELTFHNWTRTLNIIEDYLRNCLGSTKIPLAYIVRKNVNPPDDPPEGYSNNTEELIARAPHFLPRANDNDPLVHTQAYKDDNILVFNKLAAMLRDKDCWTYMQKAARARDGRKAFMSLKEHYLGKNNGDNLETSDEQMLAKTTYSGETRRWNFEKYVKTHVDQHQILQDLTEHGYAGIDERSKVRYLMDGIHTHTLDHIKTHIMGNAELRSNFDGCVNLFQDFLKQQSSSEPRRSNVSAVGRGSRGPPRSESQSEFDKISPDMSVEDCYYTKPEYNKLSAAKKKGLSIKRQNRGHKKGAKDSKTTPAKGKPTFQKRVVSAVNRYLKEVDDGVDDMDIDDDEPMSEDEEVQMKDASQESNRTNNALKRVKRKNV